MQQPPPTLSKRSAANRYGDSLLHNPLSALYDEPVPAVPPTCCCDEDPHHHQDADPSPPHLHGPDCGHIAIAHSSATNQVHLGFVIDGKLRCYSAPPDLTLSNICFETSPGQPLTAHPRGPQCSARNSSCWSTSPITYPLIESTTPTDCLTPLLSSAAALPSHSDEHRHHATCGHPSLQHDDHLDFLVVQDRQLVVDSHGAFATEQASSSWGSNLFLANIGHHYLGWMRPSATLTVDVPGLCCSSEAKKAKSALLGLLGVNEVAIHVVHKQVHVTFDPSQVSRETLVAALNEHHLGASLPEALDALTPPSPPAPPSPKLQVPGQVRSVLSVQGVCCRSEVPSVERICAQVLGVQSVHVNIVQKHVVVMHDSTSPHVASSAAAALTRSGFASAVLSNGAVVPEEALGSPPPAVAPTPKRFPTPFLPAVSVCLATLLWLISWTSYSSPAAEPLEYLSVAAVALALPRIALKGLKSCLRRTLDINALMSLAVVGALGIQDFHEAATVVVVFSWSDWLENRASGRARRALEAIVALKPDSAVRADTLAVVPASAVKLHERVLVRVGEKVPVDGKLVAGASLVDESTLTGESAPVHKQGADLVFAGTINVGLEALTVECVALAADSAVARLVRLVDEAQAQRSPTEQLVERVAAVYTPVVVLAALLMATVPWALSEAQGRQWLYTALTLLVISCPCALVISTPITYVCALAQSAGMGVLVKGGKHLEALAALKVLAVDKTGTLTRGAFDVYEAVAPDPSQRPLWLGCLLQMEQQASHPLAKALVALGGTPVAVSNVSSLPGEGLEGRLPDGSLVQAGSLGLVTRLGLVTDEVRAWAEPWLGRGATLVFVVGHGKVGLCLAAGDSLRPEAPASVAALNKLGLMLVMLTGDNPKAARAVADELAARGAPLVEVHAGLLPENKVALVADLEQRLGKVGMVGDGVNDAPALSAASVGIAMGATGSPLALETADCALMDNDLGKLPKLIKLARATRRKIIENLAFSMATKALMVGLAIAGYVSLGVAIAVDVGTMLLVTLNGVSLMDAPRAQAAKVDATSADVQKAPSQQAEAALV